ncbi:hypothetical protein [Sagittula salina]|uniref:Uncharacterized protein n=1 Tax=Sagittula salina TaxID=2820268 RepID=A0A940MSZ8_9RHOB|nr:hypothetical protein [Sagittula salina]MBP0484492.1 hypothetical protein [Sagittula salina]
MRPPPRILLHVSAPKCGSSALQTALSASPVLRGSDGSRIAYLAALPARCRGCHEGWIGRREAPYHDLLRTP